MHLMLLDQLCDFDLYQSNSPNYEHVQSWTYGEDCMVLHFCIHTLSPSVTVLYLKVIPTIALSQKQTESTSIKDTNSPILSHLTVLICLILLHVS